MVNNVYLAEPKKIGMAQSGWDEFVRLRDLSDSHNAALDYIKRLHVEHVRKLLAADALRGDGALIVTDIPDFDLSLVDAHFPSLKTREVTLFSKLGATLVTDILTKKRSVQPLRN